MFTRQTYRLDKTEPALIVKHGHAAKKHFYLNQRGVILGSSRGCDIRLESPDISGVHCVITRSSSGLYIRDCGSRLGTKVNGHKIDEAPLHSGDVLQIGLFSFDVYVPGGARPVDPGSAEYLAVYRQRIDVLERARERLVRLGLSLRRRLREARTSLRPTDAERTVIARRLESLCEVHLVGTHDDSVRLEGVR